MANPSGLAGPGAGYPQWLFNTTTHAISEVTSPETKAIAESVSWPAKLIFFTSDSAAQAYAKGNGGGVDISPVGKAVSTGTDKATAPVTNSFAGLSQIGSFFSALSSAGTWVRVAKVALGGTLLIVGLAHITGAGTSIGRAARKAPLPV